jgi:hypothetical protein
MANGCPECLVASATLASATALPPAALSGHVMPNFPHILIGLGTFANQDCTIVFTQTAVTVYHPDGHPILSGWQDETCRGHGIFLSLPRLLIPRMQLVPQRHGRPSQLPCCFMRHHPVSGDCLPQWLSRQPCLQHFTLIPARASWPPTRPGSLAWSTTYTAQPRLFPWLPKPQVPHLTHTALISPALVPWLGSIMPAWASLSSKIGLMLSKLATVTPSKASPTPMQPNTVRMPMRRSWAILPSNAKMSGGQNPSQLCWRL